MGRSEPIYEDVVGQVKFFLDTKGYGFIKVFEPNSLEDDIYFNISDCKADVVDPKAWFKFDVVETDQGLRAIDLMRVRQPPEPDLMGTSFKY